MADFDNIKVKDIVITDLIRGIGDFNVLNVKGGLKCIPDESQKDNPEYTKISPELITTKGLRAEKISPKEGKTVFMDGSLNIGGQKDLNGNIIYPEAGTLVLNDTLVNSSLSLKEEVKKLTSQEAYDLVKSIEPVKFKYKDDEQKRDNIGFIAEEMPDLFSDSTHKTVRFFQIISAMTKVVQEQQKTIDEMRSELDSLKVKINGI